MIDVTVKWFAAYRELTGVDTETLETAAATPAELFDEVAAHRHQALGGRDSALVAINEEMADWTAPLTDGDQILFFPPVAGG